MPFFGGAWELAGKGTVLVNCLAFRVATTCLIAFSAGHLPSGANSGIRPVAVSPIRFSPAVDSSALARTAESKPPSFELWLSDTKRDIYVENRT